MTFLQLDWADEEQVHAAGEYQGAGNLKMPRKCTFWCVLWTQ